MADERAPQQTTSSVAVLHRGRHRETRPAPNGVIFIEANRHLRVSAMKKYIFQYSEVPRNTHDPEHLRPTLPAGIVYLSNPAH
jgi:hypothetical protein